LTTTQAEHDAKFKADHAGAGKYQARIGHLAKKLFAEGPLSLAERKELKRAVRNSAIPGNTRNEIATAMVKLEDAEQAAAVVITKGKSATVPLSPKLSGEVTMVGLGSGPRKHKKRALAKLVKALKVGDLIWWPTEDGASVDGRVNHITKETVTVEVGGIKDKLVYKTSILDVEAATE